jgi:F-type H+-transporting ATPase subunit delta
MATDDKDYRLAQRLAHLVISEGASGVGQLAPALKRLLEDRSYADQRRFLKLFKRIITRECHKDTLVLESAQPLAPATVSELQESFQKTHARPLMVEQRINPDLIAGIKVRLGDSVLDASLHNKLQALAARL